MSSFPSEAPLSSRPIDALEKTEACSGFASHAPDGDYETGTRQQLEMNDTLPAKQSEKFVKNEEDARTDVLHRGEWPPEELGVVQGGPENRGRKAPITQPGAVAVGGRNNSDDNNDDTTLVVGDVNATYSSSSVVAVNEPPQDSSGIVVGDEQQQRASQVTFGERNTTTETPLTARVVQHDEEELLRRIERLENERDAAEVVVASAETSTEEESSTRRLLSCPNKKRILVTVGVLLTLAVLAIVLGVVFSRRDNGNSGDKTQVGGEQEEGGNGEIEGEQEKIPTDLYNMIATASPDNGTALMDTSSPQYRALEWLANNSNLDFYPETKIKHRYAMATFHIATNGQNSWKRNDGWLTDNGECFWYRYIVPGGNFQPPTCDEDGVISVIALKDQNLNGTLPPEMALLTNGLDFLNLGDNPLLAGSIPSAMGLLTDLLQLLLFDTNVNGPVPTEIGLMVKMDHLNLRDIELTGTIPTELGQMRKLDFVNIANSLLSGTIPTEIGRMSAMTDIRLNGNSLSGPIPSEVGLLTSLKKLYLNDNKLTGTLPTEMQQLIHLERLRLNGNLINATCPSWVADCRI